MLGKGWFPEQLGGSDRYFRDLLEHLPEASGVVIGAAPVPRRVAAVSGHRRPLPDRLAAFWRATQAAAERADVVDSHFALYALAPLWVGRLRRKPVVVHFHGPWADENVSAGDRSRVRLFARRMLERAAYARADEVVVLTSAFRQVLVERYGVPPWRVNVEPPGVDLERFTPGGRAAARMRLGLEPDAFVAVSVRRLVPRMGLEVLLEAWRVAMPDLPRGSTLLVAGDGPLRADLAQSVRRLGLTDSVRLLGRVPDRELADLYRAADVAVVPSLEHEGFGLVVLEAAACGTPSLVTSVGGLPEAVARLDRTLVVAPGDAPGLADRLIRAQHDRPDRDATREFAEQFEWKRVADRHRRIHRRAAAGRGADSRVKVVYIDHVAQMSGGEIALTRLLPHLDKVNPHVILGEDGPLVDELHRVGISTEVFPLRDRTRDLRKDDVTPGGVSAAVAASTAAHVLRLAVRLRRLQPDLVHTNSLKAGVYGGLAARLAGIPLVWHVRDRIAEDYLPAPATALIRSMTSRLASAVIANSKATMETLVGDQRKVVIYSVLPEVMSAAPVTRTGGGPATYGIVGRLSPWKGQDLFLRAFADAFPDGPERAVVVGAALFGEDHYALGLRRLAETLGIAGRVDFRGFRSDVWDELSRLDALVHASVTPEPFGQVVLEGMAAGVPVIAANAGGPAEILEHEVTGLLYTPGSATELAAAMRRVRDRPLADRLVTNASGEVKRYEPRMVAAQLQAVYDALVERRATR